MTSLKRILIMAGGTGGHIFPGLAVARKCQEKNIEVLWMGTEKGLEKKLVTEANIPLRCITISGVRGKNWKAWIRAPFDLIFAIFSAAKIIRQFQPDVVLGFGGFVSGPGGIASGLLRYPLVIHEQNAKAGTTNRWLSHVARCVLQGFPQVFKRGITVGNPVRREIIESVQSEKIWPDQKQRPLNLLVLGGSLGATVLNQLLPQSIALLSVDLRPMVRHQSGEKHFSDAVRAWEIAGLSAKVEPFIKDMAEAYAWSDIVLCRAGALTIAELSAAGRGAILVPYPYAVDDHQTANARILVKADAAILLPQAILNAGKLADVLYDLISAPERCRIMGQAALTLRVVDTTEKILFECEKCVRGE